MSRRMPWAQRPMRCAQPAREVAVAAEQILQNHIADPALLDRVLNMIELSVHQHLVAGVTGQHRSSGFDPGTGAPGTTHPSRSRLEYSHRARGAADVASSGPNFGATSHVSPGNSDRIADPAAAMDRGPRPQPQQPQPNAQPQRPRAPDVPWL